MPEKPAALEAFGRGVREGAGQRLGVIPTPTQISRVRPVQPGLTKFYEISMICKRTDWPLSVHKDYVVKKTLRYV